MKKEELQKILSSPRRKERVTVTIKASQILWRLKIASLVILISIGLFLKAIVMWVVGLIQAGVSFGFYTGPLFDAAGDLVNSIFLAPVRFVVAIAFIFGIPQKWLETVLPSIVPHINTQSSLLTVGAGLEGADLRNAKLEFANLKGARLSDANLTGANLKCAGLDRANLEAADLWRANLEGANLESANLKSANLMGAVLSNANLAGANLEYAGLKYAHLNGAHLKGASLESANLEGASLVSANLESANLRWATLKYADLTGAKYDKTTKWRDGFDPVAAKALLQE